MQDNQCIIKHNVNFNRLVICTGWDDSVLHHCYYTGLAERVRDIMGQLEKPTTLETMKTLAHSIDPGHWERLQEKSCSGKNKSNNKSDNKPDKVLKHCMMGKCGVTEFTEYNRVTEFTEI
jgi:hypothetical protein